MPWFEAHDTLGRHPKTLRLAETLKIKRREAVGLLHDLFAWGLYAARKDGALTGMTEYQIGLALDCETKKSAQKIVNGLLEAGFLEQDDEGTYYIHDWYDYAGKFCDERDRNKQKMKEYRDRKKAKKTGNRYGNVTVTEPEPLPDCNGDVTGQPNHNLTLPTSYDRLGDNNNILPRTGDGADSAPPAPVRKSESVAYYCQCVNATPSAESLSQLEHFEAELGAEVCKLAMDRALDNRSPRWPYIRGILRSWSEAGVKCLADVQAMDERHQRERKASAPQKRPSKGPVPADQMNCRNGDEKDVAEREEDLRRLLEQMQAEEKNGAESSG